MRLDEIPMPPAVAARPRDARGFPVLAITPWSNGTPDFAATSTARILVCAVERRCSICGTPLGKGPVWRVVAGDEAAAIARALGDGVPYSNAAKTVEPPGHHACMLYAAMVCPYLVRPTGRRGTDAAVPDARFSRGEAHGSSEGLTGAVAAFDGYEFEVAQVVLFRFGALRSFLPYALGDEHFAALREAIAALPAAAEPCPAYLLNDDSAAEDRAARYA
ncbi:MAG TPA: hypothetical protein VFA06_25330 [Actinocrinis sp.]|jgi:hypothetical protein|uniref:hypothetical protein n=1 Tax=Actinocrinis sp. TaxID=1920516 RepID=UPI002D24C0A8|nr:hypothetical protein [Actinocrinis sp.]HZU59228.1 hypothetical protein [Actinocrinis sp.]